MPEAPLSDLVWEAGVVGAGGAGFPTWKKLEAKVDTVIANGAECEPLLRNDQAVMARFPGEIVSGLRAMMRATGAKRGVIALKEHYRASIAGLRKALAGKKNISLHLLPEVYPAGDEFVLVYEVTGRIIPAGGLPLQLGVVVSNVETIFNIERARAGVPVTHRHLTVTGAVRKPRTMRLPIGTPLREAVELAGGATGPDWRAVSGGPMMGTVVADMGEPVTKTTSSVIVLPAGHQVLTRKTRDLTFDLRTIQSACCGCEYCTLVCPRSLLGHNFKPHLVMRSLAMGFPPAAADSSHAAACCNCDLCGVYSCPMELAVGRLNRRLAGKMRELKIERVPQPSQPRALPLREASLVPVKRLTARLGLDVYDRPLPHDEREYHPARVVIPLRQHIGEAAAPVVRTGAGVKAGDLIADLPRGKMGARVHASIGGRVAEVGAEAIIIEA